jgi:catechol 2,3-dioxygenase-like lactoylglutathione lyase family enzyme
MKRVTGIGGIFFKTADVEKTREWYREHLGIGDDSGYVSFEWRELEAPDQTGSTQWCLFKQQSKYFDPSGSTFMVNYRVADLHGLMKALEEEGVEICGKPEDTEFGKFGWIMDPEGNKIELWEPPVETDKS